jgi:hypothetical protein
MMMVKFDLTAEAVPFMKELVTSGRIVDIIVAVMAIEAVALVIYHRWSHLGLAPEAVFANLGAGLFILVALRVALDGGSWIWIAGLLAASFAAHFCDLLQRWRRT